MAERVDCLDITSFLLYEPVISSNLSYDFDLSFLSSLDINSFTYLYWASSASISWTFY